MTDLGLSAQVQRPLVVVVVCQHLQTQPPLAAGQHRHGGRVHLISPADVHREPASVYSPAVQTRGVGMGTDAQVKGSLGEHPSPHLGAGAILVDVAEDGDVAYQHAMARLLELLALQFMLDKLRLTYPKKT